MAIDPRIIMASSKAAGNIFGPDGPHPIRQKSLFFARFLRRVGEGGEEWKDGLSFVLRTIERPSVQPVVEELNQYNKKRLITTGVKYTPINCTLYDTADGAAMNMWAQYARYYFGDFRQTPVGYSDDITSSQMTRGTGDGFGFGIRPTSQSDIHGLGSQHFFEKIEVMQVYGGEYTGFELINPKITSFTPDELDYGSSDAATISLQISYEAIYYINEGKPAPLTDNEAAMEVFTNEFYGDIHEVDGLGRQNSFISAAGSNIFIDPNLGQLFGNPVNAAASLLQHGSDTSSLGGVLSRFGNFNFGNFGSLSSNVTNALPSGNRIAPSLQSTFGGVTRALPFLATGANIAQELEHDAVAKRDGKVSLNNTALAAINSQSNGTSQFGVRMPVPTSPIDTSSWI